MEQVNFQIVYNSAIRPRSSTDRVTDFEIPTQEFQLVKNTIAFPSYLCGTREGIFAMSILTQQILVSQELYLSILVESFLRDRKAIGLAKGTVSFYQEKLGIFLKFCKAQGINQLTELTADSLRTMLLVLGETHNSGGVHGIFRATRVFLRWVDDEEVIPDWKNPISKVRSPKLPIEPIEGVEVDEVRLMLKTCKAGQFTGARDSAILLVLFDTGVRASELLDINLQDINLFTSEILIRQGKGRKPRTVFFGERTRKAIRTYLRFRRDSCDVLFTTDESTPLRPNGLREILKRRAKKAGLKDSPSPHDFRRGFSLAFLRAGGEIFTLQRLLGHASLDVLRRYLAQTDLDGLTAHRQFSPVDRM